MSEQHYDAHLASYYTWMSGGFDEAAARSRATFERLGLRGPGRAIDLGCGAGAQAIPLADLGFSVLAVDSSARMLEELRERAGDRGIDVARADLLELAALAPRPVELCVCMGDTLTHLASLDEVERLARDAWDTLAPGGALVLSFRDLTARLEGLERVLLLRSDERRIATVLLEQEEDHVRVTDLLHERAGSSWTLAKSTYRKVRIAPEWLEQRLGSIGFSIEHARAERGLVELLARRPAA